MSERLELLSQETSAAGDMLKAVRCVNQNNSSHIGIEYSHIGSYFN